MEKVIEKSQQQIAEQEHVEKSLLLALAKKGVKREVLDRLTLDVSGSQWRFGEGPTYDIWSRLLLDVDGPDIRLYRDGEMVAWLTFFGKVAGGESGYYTTHDFVGSFEQAINFLAEKAIAEEENE